MNKKIFLLNDRASILVDSTKDINTEFGILKAQDMKKAGPGDVIKTHTGVEFYVVSPKFPDLFGKVIRLPQVITLKDIGSIVMYLGIRNDSKIVEAGTGSGVSACVMASIASKGEVTSYEIRKDFIKVAKKNMDLFGVKNVKIVNSDIREGIKERDVDAVLLDMPDPWNALETACRAIVVGGRICTYSPSIIQIERTLRAMPKELKVEKLIQTVENGWKVDMERDILRPESSGITHTAFLLFMRKTKG